MGKLVKKIVRSINVDLDKCNGCRACEIACAAYHAKPRYSSFNPNRARIRMVIDAQNDEWVAVRSTNYTKAECDGRRTYTINGKKYSECSFCGMICPSRDLFKEPDSGLPLKCDMCEGEKEPLCVQICSRNALTYEEREVEVEADEQVKPDEMELGLQSLIDKYGMQKLSDAFARMSQKG
ncbi:MAG: (4Fe-4S)-binding protein [Peptococcaceae bacterium]|nr:(4Fe-4S)-binding protein [Peptococcaceae bacterium]